MAKKIVTADDDPTIRSLIEPILTSFGYEVRTACNGQEALEKIKEETPDLVILDVMMPEMNGYDVCYQLRFNEDFKQIPIILLTSRDQELDESLGERSNIEYLQKPIDSKRLLEKIKILLPDES